MVIVSLIFDCVNLHNQTMCAKFANIQVRRPEQSVKQKQCDLLVLPAVSGG